MASTNTEQERALLANEVIPDAVKSLRGKGSYVNSVIQYCGEAYATEDKEEVRKVTKDYLTEILGVVCQDIESVASNLSKFLDHQNKAVETLTCQLDMVANRLRLIKEQKSKAMMDEIREEVKVPSVELKHGQREPALFEDEEFFPQVVPERHITVAERLSQIDDYDVVFRGK